MKTILVTGGIGSGKSEICSYLAGKGYPVYDCDSRCKALYDKVEGLKERVEEATGVPFSGIGIIFKDDVKREALEKVVYPELVRDFINWRGSLTDKIGTCFIESAIALEKRSLDGLYDSVWMVDAPLEERIRRNPKAGERAPLQHYDKSLADELIENSSTKEHLREQIDKLIIEMKTDLAKILSVSGHHGLYLYLAQARNGVIAETLKDKKRTALDAHCRITTLEDIAIYTSDGEMKLSAVFTALNAAGEVPASKSSDSDIKAFFLKAIPNYDADRFYVSHMKKILDWYSEIVNYASLDFVTDEDREKETAE